MVNMFLYQLKVEEEKGVYKKEILDDFSNKVNQHKIEFLELLRDLKKQGKKIVGISAPAKGNTLLNFCKIHDDLIDYMTEKSKIKLGHYTPGMHIPIIEEKNLLESDADYGIIFAWNFADEIIKNSINQEFMKRGGKFIKPIPKPVIMENKIEENIINNTTQDKDREVQASERSSNYLDLDDTNTEKESLFGIEVKKIDPVFIDERGIISDLLNESIGHVGLITTGKDAIRANHYHKLSTQYSYILSGKFEVLIASADQPVNVSRVIVNAGELIIIPPNVIHRFKAIERAVMIDMISESRDGNKYEDDVYRIKIEMGED